VAVCYEDGAEEDMQLPPQDKDCKDGKSGGGRVLKDAVLMPLAWSADVAHSPKWDWWGHKYASNLRDGSCRPDVISTDEMKRRCGCGGKASRDSCAASAEEPRKRFAASLPVARLKRSLSTHHVYAQLNARGNLNCKTDAASRIP